MSGTVLATSTETAEDRLVQAIKRFEAQLSPDQRKIYTQNQDLKLRPGASDVSKLLGEVDRLVKAKHGTRSAFKPRLESVIMAVQKFASIGDVMIGGSQNLIASGVWSIVRIALLATVTSLSTLQELSSLFMAVGSSAPYHEELVLLYPQSSRLRTFIYEYHIVVVEICRQLLIAVSKSIIGKLRFAFSDQNYRAQLERWGSATSREIQLSMAKGLDKQTSETSIFRTNILQKFTEDRHARRMKARYELLKACSMYEYRSSLQWLQKAGTAGFFLSESAYVDWRAKKGSTLLISGKLGAGKSVLCGSIIGDLTTNGRNSTVCYFFCRHDIPQSLKARTVAGALCKQILESVVDLSIWNKLLVSYVPPLDIEAMKSLILRALPPDTEIYLVVDGLDECEQNEQSQLFELLKFLQKNLGFRICVSHRTQPCPPSWTKGWLLQHHLSIPEENPDIQSYIRLELARRLECGELKLNDPNVIEEIYTTLRDGSGGMFLWVVLQMDCICYEETDERIRNSLIRLPKTLPELYARILSRAAQGDAYHDQDRGFQLILAAFRPLKKDEIGEALCVTPGDTTYDPRRHAHDVDRLLARCGSLVVVDEEYRTVQLVHQSARTYLMVDHVPAAEFAMDEDSVHRVMADVAITYLSYGTFDRQVSTNVITPISAQTVQRRVVESVLNGSTSKLAALRLLHKISGADFNLAPSLDTCGAGTDETSSGQRTLFPFHHYAEEYFALHALVYDLEEPMWRRNLLIKLLGNKTVPFKPYLTRWETYSLRDLAIKVLNWAENSYLLVRNILTPDQNQQNLIAWCLQNNHQHLARRCSVIVNDINCRFHFWEESLYTERISECFCLAVEKTNYEIASILFHTSMWRPLLRDNPIRSAFLNELRRLWILGKFEAVKWIGDYIVEMETGSKNPILGEMSGKPHSFAGALHKRHMLYWQQQLQCNDDRAISAISFVVSVPIINYLCKESLETTKGDHLRSPRQQGCITRLKDGTSREVNLQHLEKWNQPALSTATSKINKLLVDTTSDVGIMGLFNYELVDETSVFIELASRPQQDLPAWMQWTDSNTSVDALPGIAAWQTSTMRTSLRYD